VGNGEAPGRLDGADIDGEGAVTGEDIGEGAVIGDGWAPGAGD